MGSTKRLGRWLLYGVCIAPALIMLGYYWLEYVPDQREYFMNLRFRTLAIIGNQLSAKVSGLAKSLENAVKPDQFPADSRRNPAEYLGVLVPILNYHNGCHSRSSSHPSVKFDNPDGSVRFEVPGCVVGAPLNEVFSFVKDDLFDDVVVAEQSGRVVYQRSTSSPRVARLSELLKSGPDANSASKAGSDLDADAVRPVRLDDSDFMLLLQPVEIELEGSSPVRMMLGGLVHSARLADEAHHVPPKYLLVVFAPVLVILLSGPFLKILLLTQTGRLAFRDLALLSLCTVLAAGLVTLVMASWHQYSLSEKQTEPHLDQFAGSVDAWLASDVKEMRSAVAEVDQDVDKTLARTAGQIQDRTGLQASDLHAESLVDRSPFVFWTNEDGCQVAKWTTKRFTTGRVDQKPEAYFRNIKDKKFWWVDGQQFTLETRVSPTTSQLVVVLAIPAQHPGLTIDGCEDNGEKSEPSAIVSAAIVSSLPPPLVPPGFGFAIFQPDGRVLFHSSPDRDLYENFFEEIHAPKQVLAGVTMRAGQPLTTFYRGREYQFQVQPVTGLAGVPWNIAVFRELEPRQAMIGLVMSETLILFVTLVCLMVGVFLLFSLVLGAWRGWPRRRLVDYLLTCVWPDPARFRAFRQLSWALALMLLVSLAVVFLGWSQGYRYGGWLFCFSFLVPVAALALAVYMLRRADPSDGDILPPGRMQHAYVRSLTLLLILLAIVPAAGLFGVCHAYENRLYLMHWQRELLNAMEARQTQMAAVAPSQKVSDLLGDFWGTSVSSGAASGQPISSSLWQDLLARIRPQVEDEGMETEALAGGQTKDKWSVLETGGRRLVMSSKTGLTDLTLQSALPVITIPSDPIWWLEALALVGLMYAWAWLAFGRVFNLGFLYTPLPTVTALGLPDKLTSHLLVLGLPLVRKDKAVQKWLGYLPPRVNLYEESFGYNWTEKTLERLRGELAAVPNMALQAAATGSATAKSVRAVPWVHISNLEAKLSDPDERQTVANLMEKLILTDIGEKRVRLVVTSAVDPVFHFDSVLSDERKKIYEHPLPEPELQRLARILHNFRKAQVSGPSGEELGWEDSQAAEIVYAECRQHPALVEVGDEVVRTAAADLPREALLAMVGERAQALYKLFWATCTRPEKLLLIQLAQTGLVNPLCLDTLEELIRKGLILPGPPPRIMNETFQRFLEKVEGHDTVREWEGEAGESSWLIVRNVVVALLALGLVVLALTQQPALQTVTAVLTGVGTVLAGLFRVFGFFGSRRASNATGDPA
jgi:hypothetical protein